MNTFKAELNEEICSPCLAFFPSSSLCLLRTFLHNVLCFLLPNINSRNIKFFVRERKRRAALNNSSNNILHYLFE